LHPLADARDNRLELLGTIEAAEAAIQRSEWKMTGFAG
jgi:hypothetical protein